MGSAMTCLQPVRDAKSDAGAGERYNLYFLDSMTIGNSRAMRAAQERVEGD